MKIRVEKTSLTQVLQKLQNITEKKTSMPILSNALLKASEDQVLEFSATDLEISLWTKIPATVEVPGSTTLSARKLLEIVRELPQELITMETLPNDRVLIQSGRSRFELSTIPAEDFPLLNFYQDIEFFKTDAEVLRKALDKTQYGIPTEDDPFSISGLFWHAVESGGLRFVSSDGHRLVYYEVPAEAFPGVDVGKGVIIPRKGVQEILRAIEKENDVELGIHGNGLVVRTPGTLLSIQLLDSDFPEYQLIIPDERTSSLTVDWEVLYHALKRVSILTNVKWRHVRLVITKGSLELESGNPELGNANDVFDVDYDGEDFSVAFNVRYVLDAIQAMGSTQVRFEWVDQYHGGVFVDAEDPGYLSLIMPMVV